MQRRKFLGFLGGSVFAAPTAAKSAADMTMGDLSLERLGISAGNELLAQMPADDLVNSGPIDRAKRELRAMLRLPDRRREIEKRQRWITALDPQVATLRSVALVHKIRMTRDVEFERSQRLQRSYLQGIVDKLWDN